MSSAAPLLVLSYNVSFQAMTNKAIGTAKALGAACTPVSAGSKLTRCAANMAALIDRIPEAAGLQNFDFVGMQEASRWYEFQPHCPRTLQKLDVVHSISGQASMASFYDDTKYELSREVNGQFASGRPFQILVCKDRSGNGGVIFINCHYLHDNTVCERKEAFQEIAKDLSAALDAQGLPDEARSYRIVTTGDYNEAGWNWDAGKLYATSWKPLGPMDIDTEVSINNTPYTCCKSDGDWADGSGGILEGNRGGDYIFDSAAPAKLEIPPTYDPRLLCSDHLPVIAKL